MLPKSKSIELVRTHIKFSHQELLYQVAEHGRATNREKYILHFLWYRFLDFLLINKSQETIPAFYYRFIN